MVKENQEFSHTLPQVIVFDILLRLPVKSILRFKSVCKSWCSLISSPQFVKEQIDLANSPGNSRPWRCLYNKRRYKGLKSVDCNANACSGELRFGRSTMRSHYKILGSCNGLLLVMNCEEKKLLCWNPSTGKHHYLREELPTMSNSFSPTENLSLYGLCYDSSSDDYKVVFATRDQFKCDGLSIFLYSFRTNTWKQVYCCHDNVDFCDKRNDIFPYNFFTDKQGTTINGAPHWVLFKEKHDKFNAQVICYFDPAEEKFRELSLPCFFQLNCHSIVELDVFGGCLSLTRNIGGGSLYQYETWVMREYGVEKSWTKLFVIPTLPYMYYYRPLGFTTNSTEQVLMEVGRNRLVVYNLKDVTATHVSSLETSYPYHSGFELSSYVESLAFPVMITME